MERKVDCVLGTLVVICTVHNVLWVQRNVHIVGQFHKKYRNFFSYNSKKIEIKDLKYSKIYNANQCTTDYCK